MLPDVNVLVLDPPSSLVVTPLSTSSIQLSWDSVEEATSYNVYRSLEENGTYNLIGNTTETTYIDTRLLQNTTYFYRIQGINETEVGIPSAPVEATTIALAPPTNITVTSPTFNQVILDWDAVPGATSYNVYRSTSAVGPYTLVTNTVNTTYTDTNLLPNTTYYYQLTSLINGAEGDISTPVSITTQQQPIPTTPINLNAVANQGRSITLTWNEVENANYYTIYRSTNINGPFTPIATSTNTTYTDQNLQPNTTYYYQVNATNETGTSANSNTASATTNAMPTSTLIAEVVNRNTIRLNWTMVNGATSYVVYRSTNINGPFIPIATTSSTQYLDSNIENNTTYYYQVVPYVNSTPGTPSNIANATLQRNNSAYCCYCCYCCNCYRTRNWLF